MSPLGRVVGLGIKARWGLSLDAASQAHAEERADAGVRQTAPSGGHATVADADSQTKSSPGTATTLSPTGIAGWMRRCISAGPAVSLSPPGYLASSARSSLPVSRQDSDGDSLGTFDAYEASTESSGDDYPRSSTDPTSSPSKQSGLLIDFTPPDGDKRTALPYPSGAARRSRHRHRPRGDWTLERPKSPFGLTRKIQKAAQYWVLALLMFLLLLQVVNITLPVSAESDRFPTSVEYKVEQLRNTVRAKSAAWMQRIWKLASGRASLRPHRSDHDKLAYGLWSPEKYADIARAVREGVAAGPSTTVPPDTRFGPPPHLATLPEDLLNLTKDELTEMRRYRRANLWAAPSKELETFVLPPRQGSEHEATVIFLHVSHCVWVYVRR